MTGPEGGELRSVSVVIPTVGRLVLAQVVRECLADAAVREVVVVADANASRVMRVLDDAGLVTEPRVRIIPGSARGCEWARQMGVDATTGDVVLFLDDDVVPGPGLVTGHLRQHRVGPNRVVLGYMPVAAGLRAASVTACIYGNDYESACREFETDPAMVLSGLWAGNVSMRRSECDRVPQGVDWYAFHRQGDREFGLRCARAGLIGVFDRSLVAEHRYERGVKAFLELSGEQARAGEILRAHYPESGPVPDPSSGFPRPALWALRASGIPLVGPVLQSAVNAMAQFAGRGRATRQRVRTVVFARTVAQRHAVTHSPDSRRA